MKWLLLLLLLVLLAAWLLWTPDRSVENLQQRYLRAPDDFVQLAEFACTCAMMVRAMHRP